MLCSPALSPNSNSFSYHLFVLQSFGSKEMMIKRCDFLGAMRMVYKHIVVPGCHIWRWVVQGKLNIFGFTLSELCDKFNKRRQVHLIIIIIYKVIVEFNKSIRLIYYQFHKKKQWNPGCFSPPFGFSTYLIFSSMYLVLFFPIDNIIIPQYTGVL